MEPGRECAPLLVGGDDVEGRGQPGEAGGLDRNPEFSIPRVPWGKLPRSPRLLCNSPSYNVGFNNPCKC